MKKKQYGRRFLLVVCICLIVALAGCGQAQEAPGPDQYAEEESNAQGAPETGQNMDEEPNGQEAPEAGQNKDEESDAQDAPEAGQTMNEETPLPDVPVIKDNTMPILNEAGEVLCRLTLDFSMTREEVKEFLIQSGVEFNENSDATYEMEYYFIFFNRRGTIDQFYFNGVSSWHPLLETEQGLKIGDPEERIEELHGACDNVRQEELTGERRYDYAQNGYNLSIWTTCAEDDHTGPCDPDLPQYIRTFVTNRTP